MIRGLKKAAESLGLPVEPEPLKNKPLQRRGDQGDFGEEDVPMMYRAQVEGRCSLMFAGSNKDLERWKDEWVDPNPEKPRYQREKPPLGLQEGVYRIEVKFPFRLISNCGQDNIIRPVLGKNGIPYLSGSSVKGLFRRACIDSDQVEKYCGDKEKLSPSSHGFRFHGAYPIGDWSRMQKVKLRKKGKDVIEVRHRMLDVVHPQQERQLGSREEQRATALASVSLYQPTMIFEFSSANPETDWKEVENIFWRAIALGVGGKTSTGYGLGGYNDNHPASPPTSKFSIALSGSGVSPTLRSNEPEFRPNLFKASLRGHFQRLLAGVTSDNKTFAEVDRLFGSSSSTGAVQVIWTQDKKVEYGDFGATKTFKAEGVLHLDGSSNEDIELIEGVLKFAFVMGGFGKSWRRISHKLFHKTYRKFEIGCHWQFSDWNSSWLKIKSIDDLKSFLNAIHESYIHQFANDSVKPENWRESWHPDRVSVYAALNKESKIIELFHDETYKTTPAIGGRIPHREHPKKVASPTYFSHVWHRMLPVGKDFFLEIVTIFHMPSHEWIHKTEGDQMAKFINSIKSRGLTFVWGNENLSAKPAKKVIGKPRKRS